MRKLKRQNGIEKNILYGHTTIQSLKLTYLYFESYMNGMVLLFTILLILFSTPFNCYNIHKTLIVIRFAKKERYLSLLKQLIKIFCILFTVFVAIS